MSASASAYPPYGSRRGPLNAPKDAEHGERVELGTLPSSSRTRANHAPNDSAYSTSSTFDRNAPDTSYTPMTRGPNFEGASLHNEHHKAWDWHEQLRREKGSAKYFAHRFAGNDRWVPWLTSVKNVAFSSSTRSVLVNTVPVD